jgi:hypothetical protein
LIFEMFRPALEAAVPRGEHRKAGDRRTIQF